MAEVEGMSAEDKRNFLALIDWLIASDLRAQEREATFLAKATDGVE